MPKKTRKASGKPAAKKNSPGRAIRREDTANNDCVPNPTIASKRRKKKKAK